MAHYTVDQDTHFLVGPVMYEVVTKVQWMHL